MYIFIYVCSVYVLALYNYITFYKFIFKYLYMFLYMGHIYIFLYMI